jgi:hypothetical protein
LSANTSPEQIAQRVLDACLSGVEWRPRDIDALVDADSDALFSIVAEGLADRFDPHLDDVYADIFSHAIARVDNRFTAAELRGRYRHLRTLRPYAPFVEPSEIMRERILLVEEKALRRLRTGGAAYHVPGIVPPPPRESQPDPERIVLLSRVTLGADIAVTSIVAQALQSRFPSSHIELAGSQKSADLLGLPLLPVDYPRLGGLRARLQAVAPIRALDKKTLIIDPDSRLTQLGVYPVADEQRYYFFDSRGISSPGSLSILARNWCVRVFEVDIPWPRIQVGEPPFAFERPAVTVSFGVGGNESKRLGGDFERRLLRELSNRAATVIVDKGAGEEEAARAVAAAEGLTNVKFWSGSFAAFASLIATSDLYVGYDSAGQHAAAALGVPLVSIFAGAINDRFFERWRPDGRVIRIDNGSPESAFVRVRSALVGRVPDPRPTPSSAL